MHTEVLNFFPILFLNTSRNGELGTSNGMYILFLYIALGLQMECTFYFYIFYFYIFYYLTVTVESTWGTSAFAFWIAFSTSFTTISAFFCCSSVFFCGFFSFSLIFYKYFKLDSISIFINKMYKRGFYLSLLYSTNIAKWTQFLLLSTKSTSTVSVSYQVNNVNISLKEINLIYNQTFQTPGF